MHFMSIDKNLIYCIKIGPLTEMIGKLVRDINYKIDKLQIIGKHNLNSNCLIIRRGENQTGFVINFLRLKLFN